MPPGGITGYRKGRQQHRKKDDQGQAEPEIRYRLRRHREPEREAVDPGVAVEGRKGAERNGDDDRHEQGRKSQRQRRAPALCDENGNRQLAGEIGPIRLGWAPKLFLYNGKDYADIMCSYKML